MSAEPSQPPPNLHGPYTDEDLHVAVTRAWCRLPSRRVRREHPMRGYVFGWHFPASLARAPVESAAVVQAVLRVVCHRSTPSGRSVSLPVADTPPGLLDAARAWSRATMQALAQLAGRGSTLERDAASLPLPGEQRGPLNAVAAWWRPLEDPDGLGIHFVELRDGPLVFLTVASRADQPDPGDSQ